MENILTVSNLNKSFNNKKVLQDVNFSIPKGKIVGLIGPNGAGKTTIMKIILGLIGFQQGTIKVESQMISVDRHAALAGVGALIENPGIYPFLSGLDHLKLFAEKETTPEQINQLVTDLKMDKYIKQKSKKYSLGMKQKLGIALALLNQPRLVILDESMNGLDPEATRDLRHLILKQAKLGTTFLISSHILGELEKVAQDLLVIDQGKIVKQTTTQALLNSSQQYLDLKTADDKAARQALLENNYELTTDEGLKIAFKADDEVSKILDIMAEEQIKVLDIEHEKGDLEGSLLSLLAQDHTEE
ncbi:ATP-binding cassette domain-containing protein [Ligilactobacillus pobuzihii]|uniref:ABC transporter ATP-binding protein n=1 Tax=Ligilactobacillus pobuzihii TaxID=449659 RepID=UPI0019D01BA6|nr:ATP-binding cassette domain-containing protein [Ligilactobacillus pobuzihii]MBN7274354.1 ATP-binding cassette domain-containing protein [Ligilactobacillus pobuzihii]